MRSNLNLLTEDEIVELENFVKSNLKKYNEDVEKFFSDLKSGKLKSKKVDVDALDFIYEGLTDIVDSWIEKNSESKVETVGEIEKLVCDKRTRVGKFLSKYNKPQITLKDEINRLKQEGRLSQLLAIIADVQTRENKFNVKAHDLEHTKRVLVNADVIMSLKNEVSDREREIILKAVEFHDTGRIHDFEDKVHGERAVQKITNELDGFSEEEQEIIKFIIVQHCKSNSENEFAIKNLDKNEEEKERYRKYLNYMKDADKLDRVRFPEIHPLMQDSLDPERLKFDESKQMIKLACELFEKSDKLFELKSNKSIKSLLNRTEIFGELESSSQLIKSVNEVLRENGYPGRSQNIKLKKVKEQDTKFIKDGYLYLLRGSRSGQMSGFYTYQYSKDKMNIEEYLKRHPDITTDELASRQSMRGRERFISATTDILIAAQFTNLNKSGKREGSLYVLKVKPEEAFKVKSAIDSESLYGYKSSNDEKEYLIPDFVKPEEVVKEFKYNDYIGVYDYLRKEIGLDIDLNDLGLTKEIAENPESVENMIEFSCIQNERQNKYWQNNSTVDLGFDILSKLANNGEKAPTVEKILKFLTNLDEGDDWVK